MAPVQENMAQLTPGDRKAIAAYIKSLPPRPDAVPKSGSKAGAEEGGAESGEGGAKETESAEP